MACVLNIVYVVPELGKETIKILDEFETYVDWTGELDGCKVACAGKSGGSTTELPRNEEFVSIK